MNPSHSERFVAIVDEARAHIREAGVEEIARRLEKGDVFHLIDVREESEWAAEKIPGARHLGRGVLERDIARQVPDTEADIVLYCGGGYRSALAAESLQRMGYTRVTSMNGGIRGWKASGRRTVEADQREDEGT